MLLLPSRDEKYNCKPMGFDDIAIYTFTNRGITGMFLCTTHVLPYARSAVNREYFRDRIVQFYLNLKLQGRNSNYCMFISIDIYLI